MAEPHDQAVIMGNKARSIAFRNEILLHFHARGFRSAARKKEPKGMSLHELMKVDRGDIVGLPWTILARNQLTIDASAMQDLAKNAALDNGHELYAVIQSRRTRDVSESYVTLPLSVFTRVLARLHPEIVTPRETPS